MGRALGSLVLLLSAARAEIALNGRVTDENSAPLAGVRVTLGRFLAVSDPGGAFVIRVDSAGEYSLSAQREGYYQAQERAVRLSDGPNEIALTLQTIREVFESVTVAASPPGIDTSTTAVEHAITGAQILEAPYPTTHSLRHALRLFPNVVRDAAGGLHINGGAEEQVLYTLDGFNLTDPLTGRFESRLSVEAVRTVEISSGRFPAEFGKGSSGTMSIRSRTGDDKLRYSATNFIPGIGFHKGFGLQDWVPRFNLSGPIRKGRAWFSDGLDTQYIRHIVEELPRGQDRTQSWRWNNLLHGQVNLTPSNILTAGFLANYWNAPRAGLDALNPPETTIDRRARQWFFYVKEQLYVRRGWLVEVGYARNRTFGREIPQGSDLFRLTPEGQRGNYFIDATRKAGRDQALANLFLPALEAMGAHQIKLGLDLDRLHYEQDVRRSGYEHYRVDGTLLSRVVFGGSGRLDRSNLEAASYIQDSWRVRPNLLVEAGIRQDWDRLVGNTNLSPRLGFGYSPRGLENTRISGGYGIVYDATSLRTFTRPLDQYSIATFFSRDGGARDEPAVTRYSFNDRRLASPRYENYSAGVEQRLPGDLYARVNVLRKRGRNGFTYVSGALTDARRDVFDSVEITVRQGFRRQYEWLASYTRSRAFSNAVVDLSVDDPILITSNVGRMPWDSPNRFLSWGLLPTPWKKWALAYLMECRTGFPFSIHDEDGRLAGALNELRFPLFFELNLHAERWIRFRGQRWALRGGFNNITGRRNPNNVNNNTSSPHFLNYFGGQGRSTNFRLRWLGKAGGTS